MGTKTLATAVAIWAITFNLNAKEPSHTPDVAMECSRQLTSARAELVVEPIQVRADDKWVTLLPSNHPDRRVEEVSVIVPIYHELDNGNVERLLQTLRSQTLPGVKFRLVAIVNNTPELAERHDPIALENQRTVKFLNRAKRRSPFRIDVLDQTAGIERNMGRIRNVGLFHALKDSRTDPRRHLIVNLDCDVELAKNYLEKLTRYYELYEVDGVIARRAHFVPGDASARFFQTHFASLYDHMQFDLANALGYPAKGYPTPQISFRADVATRLNGFANLVYSEDLELSQRLAKYRVLQAPDLRVVVSDRARPGGFDSVARLALLEDPHTPTRAYAEIFALREHFLRHLTGGERQRFDQSWQGRLAELHALIEARRADSLMVANHVPLAAPATFSSDPYLRHLRLDVAGGLRERVDRLSRAVLPGRSQLDLLAAEFPDWLNPHFEGTLTEAVELENFLIDWILRARRNPRDFPGTATAIDSWGLGPVVQSE